MVACSPEGVAAGTLPPVEGRTVPASKAAGAEVGGVGRAGSGVEGEVGPVWFGFHIISIVSFPDCLNSLSFLGRTSLALIHANASRNV